ncbi:hypothetical protein BG004_001525, partial [Podila humilis]
MKLCGIFQKKTLRPGVKLAHYSPYSKGIGSIDDNRLLLQKSQEQKLPLPGKPSLLSPATSSTQQQQP